MFALDRSAALLAGAHAVKDPSDRRHLLLLAHRELAHRGDIVSIDADGLLEDALAAPVEADMSALVGLARDMLMQAASELDTALAA